MGKRPPYTGYNDTDAMGMADQPRGRKKPLIDRLNEDVEDESVSVEDMFKKYEKIIAARLITTALENPDAAKGNAAARDVLDRVQGKATEKKDGKHRLEKASEKELDALITSKLKKIQKAD